MKKYILLVLVLILIYSCKKNREQITFPEKHNIHCEVLDKSPFIGVPLSLTIHEDILFIADFTGDKLITKYDLENGDVIGDLAPKGIGPKEFQSPVLVSLTDSALFVFNKGRFRLGYYNLRKNGNQLPYAYFDLFEVPASVIDLIPIDNHRFLAAGYFEGSRYAIIDKNGFINKNGYFGSYPDFSRNEYSKPFEAKAMFHQPKFTANYSNNLIASISRHVFEIIDFSSSFPKRIKSLQLAPYDYNYIKDEGLRVNATPDTPIGVISLSSTNSYIYVVYNPNYENINLSKHENNEIWVFDWRGNPVEKLLPSKNIDYIVALNDNIFYGITDDLARTIVKISKN